MQPEQAYLAPRYSASGSWTLVVHLYEVERPDEVPPEDPARAVYVIAYDGLRDRLELNVRGERTAVKFGLLRVTFPWRGYDYEIRLFPLGKVDVRRGKVIVLEGHFTEEGLSFTARSHELEPLIFPLSIALNIRRKHRERAFVGV